eukprot:2228152-Rhodomonas_salina.1
MTEDRDVAFILDVSTLRLAPAVAAWALLYTLPFFPLCIPPFLRVPPSFPQPASLLPPPSWGLWAC